jgi:hypothetical protein
VERAYRNAGYALLALPALMLAGFWVPYFSVFPHFDAHFSAAVHVHALVQFSWVALAVVQPLAIRAGAFRTHRLLGRASYALAPLILVFAAAMTLKEYGEHRADGMGAWGAFAAEYLSIAGLALLTAFYLLAIARIHRRDVAGHMRYMICIAIALSPAGFGRVLGYLFEVRLQNSASAAQLLVDACLGALILYDRRRRADSGPYRLALSAMLAIQGGWLLLGRPV